MQPLIPTPEHLAKRIRAYCQTSGISPTRFGILVARDPNLVRDLGNGRSVGLKLLGRISQALHKPPTNTGDEPNVCKQRCPFAFPANDPDR